MSFEPCIRCGKQSAHTHHRKLRRHGDESPANLIRLCAVCHQWVHDNPAHAAADGYILRSHEDPAKIPLAVTSGMKIDESGALVKDEHDHVGECKVCGLEIKKRKNTPFKGEARRKRRVIALKVPDDWEDGGAVWDETLEQVKKELVLDGLYSDDEHIPNYEAVIAGLRDYIDTRALVRREAEGE